jgi:hypothetical protein
MKIIYIAYIPEESFLSHFSKGYVETEHILYKVLPKIKEKYDNVGWVGMVTNDFVPYTKIMAFVLYRGEWDSQKITDKLIRDASVPWLDYEDFESPFFKKFEELKQDRDKIKKILKGGVLSGD